MEYFQSSGVGRVVVVVCNRKNAGVIGIAAEFGVPVQMIDRNLFYESEHLLDVLENYRTDFIALAGFFMADSRISDKGLS
jgi:phosphoribosylglycinamide formyltransferase-1